MCELLLLSSGVNCRHCFCCLWLSWVPLLRSSLGIPLLGSSVFGTTDSGCGCLIPPPSRPTWFMRQAVPIDVTRLGFIHKIFCTPSPLWSNQLAAVLELLNEQKLVNEFAVYGSIYQGRTQPFWAPPEPRRNVSPCLELILWLSLWTNFCIPSDRHKSRKSNHTQKNFFTTLSIIQENFNYKIKYS